MDIGMDINSTENSTISMNGLEIPNWSRITNVVILSVIAIIGCLGNLLISSVLTRSSGKSTTDFYVLCMAFVDFVSASGVVPMAIVTEVTDSWYKTNGQLFCQIKSLLIYQTNLSSSLLLAAIAIDRFFLTCRPLSKYSFAGQTRAKYTCVLILVSGLISGLIQVPLTGFNMKSVKCFYKPEFATMAGIFGVLTMLTFIGMFIISAVCYARVVLNIRRRHQANLHRQLNAVASSSDTAVTPTNPRSTKQFPQNNASGTKGILLDPGSPCAENLCVPPVEGPSDEIISIRLFVSPQKTETMCLNSGFSMLSENKPASTIKCQRVIQNANKASRTTNSRNARVVPRDMNASVLAEKKRNANITNRVTLILFLVTSVYISTWTLYWSHYLIEAALGPNLNKEMKGVFAIQAKIYLINAMTNPIFYMSMSSKFRSKVVFLFQRN